MASGLWYDSDSDAVAQFGSAVRKPTERSLRFHFPATALFEGMIDVSFP